jgi:hypothetical protein
MKKLLLILLLLPSLVFSQLTTINPDTVCYQTGGSIYEVAATAGLSYNWTVTAPGIITGGQGTSQIQVDWSAATPGLITNAVQVQASNNIGCLSPVIVLDVFIYDINPNIIQIANICEYTNCVPLQATPAGGVWSGTGVSGLDFCPTTSGVGTFNITYTYTDTGCIFTDVIQVSVLSQPQLLPIEHN